MVTRQPYEPVRASATPSGAGTGSTAVTAVPKSLELFVDAGHVTPESIHQAAHAHGFVPTGPVRPDPRAREHPGFTKADFVPNRETHTLTCPRGGRRGGHSGAGLLVSAAVDPGQAEESGQRSSVTPGMNRT